MGTTTEKLQAIRSSKADIKSAIEGHDVEVGAAPLSEYGNKIRSIRSRITTSQSYCVGRWPEWIMNDPTAVRVDGDISLALDWYPVLLDMSPVEGEVKKRPVGWLKRNNYLRFEDGTFAPTIGITAAQKAECDVALYLDDQATILYCDAGEFDAETFYNDYGMNQALYDANGNSVRILRPWETTETKYSIGIARKDTVYLIDNEYGADGNMLRGIVADEGKVDGIKPAHKLVPTAIMADAITVIGGKARCFYFDYCTMETGCMGQTPLGNLQTTGEAFYQDGTYPRVLDNMLEGANGEKPNDDGVGMNQPKNAKVARACNFNTAKPYPVAEGGWHALNVFVSCLEAAYGTKYLHAANRFSSGISSNDAIGTAAASQESNWLEYGGMRSRVQGTSAWTYNLFSQNTSPIRYTSAAGNTDESNMLNRYAPKTLCMEAQMALSMAAELDVAPDTEFTFYGRTYLYKTPTGATSLLGGRMNARLYRTRIMTISAWNSSKVATTFDVQVRLRMPVAEGFNLCGDFWRYVGGGHEVVDVNAAGVHTVLNYLECDQTKWGDNVWGKQQAAEFDFQQNYEFLGKTIITAHRYVMKRESYGSWPEATGTGITAGECGYHYEANLASNNQRCRCGVRFRGVANSTACSARDVSSNYSVVYCNAIYGGSAQVLLDVDSAAATQSQ